jgi:hypothetical protein
VDPLLIPSADGAPVPLTVAGVLAAAVWYYLRQRQTSPAGGAPAGGWLGGLLGSRAALLAAAATAWSNRKEIAELAGQVWGLVRPLLARLAGPKADPPAGVPT